MTPPDMIVPPELLELIAAGKWPQKGKDFMDRNRIIMAQMNKPLVSEARVKLFAPDETYVALFPPPFYSMERGISELALPMFLGNPDPIYSPGDLDFSRCLSLGDFGIGSDSPIVLDYRAGPENPTVLRLRWNVEGDRDRHITIRNHTRSFRNRWVTIAPNFREFAKLLGFLD